MREIVSLTLNGLFSLATFLRSCLSCIQICAWDSGSISVVFLLEFLVQKRTLLTINGPRPAGFTKWRTRFAWGRSGSLSWIGLAGAINSLNWLQLGRWRHWTDTVNASSFDSYLLLYIPGFNLAVNRKPARRVLAVAPPHNYVIAPVVVILVFVSSN